MEQRRQGPHIAVDDEQVQVAVIFEIEKAGAEPCEGKTGHSEPASVGAILEEGVAVVCVQGVRLAVEVRDEEIDVAVVVVVAARHSHAGLGAAVSAHGAAREEPVVGPPTVAIEHPEGVGLLKIGSCELAAAAPNIPAMAVRTIRCMTRPML